MCTKLNGGKRVCRRMQSKRVAGKCLLCHYSIYFNIWQTWPCGKGKVKFIMRPKLKKAKESMYLYVDTVYLPGYFTSY